MEMILVQTVLRQSFRRSVHKQIKERRYMGGEGDQEGIL